MINRIKSIANTEDKKKLMSNFFSLSVLQVFTYILPLLTLPYLVRVLGVENFGLLVFATATVAYFGLITDYGFDLIATREISIHRDDKAKVIEIFSSVMIIKFVLMFVSFLLLAILVFSFEKFSQDALIYFLSFGVVIGQFLFPVWFFQGMERMKYITYINIGSRLLFTIAIFIFVQEKSDFYMVPVFSALGTILGGLYALYFIRTNFDIMFVFQKTATLKYYFNEAHHIFISKFAISLYTISTTFILGIFTNNTIVGYFAAAEKIIQAFKGLIGPISQTLFPYISRRVNNSREEGFKIVKKVIFYVAIFTGTVSIFIYIFSNSLVTLILGSEYFESIIVLKILFLLPFLTGLNTILGVQVLLAFNRKSAFTVIITFGSILNLFLSFILIPKLEHLGSAISIVLTETVILILMITYLQKNGLKIIGENKQ